ncbi:hypothetical protein WA026_020232 [Henosepilachna vigintioctopunctata]|uniref:CCHC-type domain-containing protein n=1 Tax=Henosepilachna vigintioctopunctata TaxID=420089 RepID=A0AAW1TVZ1_9CUCU
MRPHPRSCCAVDFISSHDDPPKTMAVSSALRILPRSHVMSFRRHVYINPQDLANIPESLLVDFEYTQYRIILSVDNVACFKCNETGHIASKCPLKTNTADISNQFQEYMTSEASESQSILPQNINEDENPRLKRTISETLTPSPDIDITEKTFVKPNKSPKKQKAEKLVDKTKILNNLLSPTKKFRNSIKFALTYDQL